MTYAALRMVVCCSVIALASLGAGDAAGQTLRDLVGATFEMRVIAVIDGDTVDAIPAGDTRAVRFRLYGVNAPERGEPYSAQARDFTRVLLFDKTVRAEGTDLDVFRRVVVRIRVEGTDASAALLDRGLACHFTRYSADEDLAGAEASARTAGRGFWAAGAARPRCAISPGTAPAAPAASGGAQQPSREAFHGNRNSRVYHAPQCRNYNCPNCTVVFATEEEARKAGFRPAGDCLGQ